MHHSIVGKSYLCHLPALKHVFHRWVRHSLHFHRSFCCVYFRLSLKSPCACSVSLRRTFGHRDKCIKPLRSGKAPREEVGEGMLLCWFSLSESIPRSRSLTVDCICAKFCLWNIALWFTLLDGCSILFHVHITLTVIFIILLIPFLLDWIVLIYVFPSLMLNCPLFIARAEHLKHDEWDRNRQNHLTHESLCFFSITLKPIWAKIWPSYVRWAYV